MHLWTDPDKEPDLDRYFDTEDCRKDFDFLSLKTAKEPHTLIKALCAIATAILVLAFFNLILSTP